MNEEEAKAWLDVPRETFAGLERFVELLRQENERQNLVSRASLDHIWSRHIVDSAQLLRFDPAPQEPWLDLGTGAGFPGLIVAALRPGPVTLIESRTLRVDFLASARDVLGFDGRVEIVAGKVEVVEPRQFAAISARAFAPLPRLLALAQRFAAPTTRWVLPKGKNAKSELEAAESLWQGEFRLEPSLTDPDAHIIIAEQVRRKTGGRKRR